ncbi:hypothetical protein [Candidatus Soleaferrea massiliensis]|uniref:hypothetical protein n=1 Tax=Candidatus Soleaferrea massiliensis TaxID=1470354 RepID=UPI00058F7017|nr:hypothetical protein [Candidatus Soleaferrea massiliensis]
MKRYISMMLLAATLLSMTACSQPQQPDEESAVSTVSTQSTSESSEKSKLDLDGTYHGEGYQLTAPRNWKLQNDQEVVLLVSPEYPDKSDCITVVETAKDPSFGEMTQDIFKLGLEAMFDDVKIQSFEKTTISESDAFRIVYTSSTDAGSQLVHQLIVDADDHTLNFTMITESQDASDWIEACEKSIQMQ